MYLFRMAGVSLLLLPEKKLITNSLWGYILIYGNVHLNKNIISYNLCIQLGVLLNNITHSAGESELILLTCLVNMPLSVDISSNTEILSVVVTSRKLENLKYNI